MQQRIKAVKTSKAFFAAMLAVVLVSAAAAPFVPATAHAQYYSPYQEQSANYYHPYYPSQPYYSYYYYPSYEYTYYYAYYPTYYYPQPSYPYYQWR